MSEVRQDRANAEILKALAVVINEKINDPRIKNSFLTFTYAKTSADFRYCKIGFSVLNGNAQEIQKVLQKSEGFIKREVMNIVSFPYTPKLTFVIDAGELNSEKVNNILKTLVIPEEDDEEGDEEI